jgi:hypothetical protein
VGPVTATFTFSAAKAAATASANGTQLPPVPAGLDGSQVRIHAGPGLAAVWGGGGPVPRLIVARLVAPTAESSGVPFEKIRDYLLSLPGLPDDLATQLRDISSDAATLPLPVPTDVASSSSADVDGHPATVLTARQGTFAGVVWVDHGIVTAVAGSFTPDEALAVARGLR